MPADYSSTARALALPISPIPSPSPDHRRGGSTSRPPWSQRLSSNSRRPYSLTSTTSRRQTYQEQTIRTGKKVLRRLQKMFMKLSLAQRVLLVLALIAVNIVGILFLIYSEGIFAYIEPAAQKWKAVPFGWTVLFLLCFICAFPPVVGFGTIVTVSGFVYGFPHGWFIIAPATVAGSLACFIASRTILSGYVHRLVGEDKRFQALALTLKHDGLKVLCMIRLCPLPYSLSNAAMSTFPTVNPLSFALATAIATPRLLIQVFIGSRLAQIAESGGKMDAGTKAINWASIIFGGVLGGSVGWIIYQKTMSRAKELESEALERAGEEGRVVLGREYSDSTIDGMAGEEDVAVLMGDDDISLWGNDDAVAYKDDDDEVDVFARGDAGSDNEGGRKPGR